MAKRNGPPGASQACTYEEIEDIVHDVYFRTYSTHMPNMNTYGIVVSLNDKHSLHMEGVGYSSLVLIGCAG